MESKYLEVISEGISLKGELTTPAEGEVPLVVLCHGIPLSRPDPNDGGYPMLARQICERGYATLFFNLRGTGDSGGDFSVGGWYEDMKAVMGMAADQLGKSFPRRFLAGFSAGGSLAIRYAAEFGGLGGVAAFAAPARLAEMFPREHLFAFLEMAKDVGIIREFDFPPDPEQFFIEIEQNSAVDYVAGVSPVPLMLVHGEEDELVPLSQARALLEAAGEPKELYVLPDGMHRLRHDPRIVDCLVEWLERLSSQT